MVSFLGFEKHYSHLLARFVLLAWWIFGSTTLWQEFTNPKEGLEKSWSLPNQTSCTVPLLLIQSPCSITKVSQLNFLWLGYTGRTKVVLVESSYCKPLPPRILLSTWFWLGLPHHFAVVNSLGKFGEGNTKTQKHVPPIDERQKEWNREADQN